MRHDEIGASILSAIDPPGNVMDTRSGQPVEDELAVEAAHLAGLAKPGQTLAGAGIRMALPETMRALANKPGRKEAVVEIVPGEAAGSPRQAADAASATSGSLRLHYGGNTLVLDEHKPVIDMGRNGTCDLVIGNPRASRQHAMIRRRGSLLVLVDSSTNGTYVTIDGHAEQFVKQSEFALHGHGVIAFAAPSSAPGADCAQFECA
jgi:hypothetical protein